MTNGSRRRKTLGRGMGDLIGNDLESLVRGDADNGRRQGTPPRSEADKDRPRPDAGRDPAPPGPPGPTTVSPGPPAGSERLSAGPAPGEPAPSAPTPMVPSLDGPLTATAPPEIPAREPCREMPAPRRTSRVFAVASGKGGTGKSLIAVNLAVAMSERQRVCVIDADFGLGNAHILLGLLPRYNVSHLIGGEHTLDEVLIEGPRGVLLLPGASGVPEMASLDDPSLDSFASSMSSILERCDVVILDCPGGLSRQSLLLLHGADVILVVTTDDLTSMTDAYALIKTLVTHRPDLTVGLVVNDARTAADGSETYRKICHVSRKFLGREILSLGTIPRDAQLERSVMERRPVVVGHPRSPSARAIQELASRLAALQGLDPALGFPERMHRTLVAAAGSAAGGGNDGEGLCMS